MQARNAAHTRLVRPRRPQLAKGFMQLHSFEQAKSQPLEAHAAAFANVKVGVEAVAPRPRRAPGPQHAPPTAACGAHARPVCMLACGVAAPGAGRAARACPHAWAHLRVSMHAHARACPCHSRAQLAGRDAPSNLIAFAQKTLKDGQVVSKLHVIELGTVAGACGVWRVCWEERGVGRGSGGDAPTASRVWLSRACKATRACMHARPRARACVHAHRRARTCMHAHARTRALRTQAARSSARRSSFSRSSSPTTSQCRCR